MPPADSAALIVARFLKANHYSETYNAFITEAGLPDSAGTIEKGEITLETLLEEKKTFDVALKFEKLGVGEGGGGGWGMPAPATGHVVKILPSSSNILSTTIASLNLDEVEGSFLLATTADRRLHVLSLPSMTLQASHSGLSDSPILSCTPYDTSALLCTTMSGTLFAINASGKILDKRKEHSKYVVGSAMYHPPSTPSQQSRLLATAGWDNKVHIYRPEQLSVGAFFFGDPIATITLPTKPESILFITHPETKEPVLLLSRTDSSFIYYYTIPTGASSSEPSLLGKQNLAPHSNAWVAFTPSSLAPHPTDPTLLAVGTNSIPHMKVLIVRLLVPPLSPDTSAGPTLSRPSLLSDRDAPMQETQASQARAALAVADREHAAIIIHANTTAPQTAYSTPCVVWRPDGSGVWVNGDDGAVRGVERSTGKVVVCLAEGEGGHGADSKVRCLAAGVIGEEEIMVSGGFDQRLLAWKE